MKNHLAKLSLPLLFLSLPVCAQIGDKQGEAQVPIIPETSIPAAPVRTPLQELATFQLAPGYRAELVASDPLIGDPVAMCFGADGRLWVVEMRGYMPDLDGSGEDRPEGRVVVLSDTNGDGVMDRAQVFLDQIVLPRAIALSGDGVLVGAPPHLWFCRDSDGDGRADLKLEIATDFGVRVDPARPQLANPERAPNSLVWGHDNCLYVGQYAARFRRAGEKWLRDASTFRGQWGLSQDDWGHLFYNSNSDQLRVDVLPSHYLARNPHLHRPAGTNWKAASEQLVWPARVSPGINRGYRPEMLRDNRLKEFTAACAPWIYRGDLFPSDAYDDAFVCEPAGNLIKRNKLQSEGGLITARPAYAESEFLASTDERFRPVNLTTGPDGALYVVDLYRGVIQHRISLTSYLRAHIEKQGLEKPVALGRIWRIVPEGVRASSPVRLADLTTSSLVEQLSHGNAWRRETAQRLLVERGGRDAVSALSKLATEGKDSFGRYHALWTLQGLTALSDKTVSAALSDSDARVRAAAVRLSESFLKNAKAGPLAARIAELSESESVSEVQQQIALSIGEAADPVLDKAGAKLCARAAGVAFVQDAFLSGVPGRELELFEAILEGKDSSVLIGLLKGLAFCVVAERDATRVERLLGGLAKLPVESVSLKAAILGAIGAHPTVNAKSPLRVTQEPPVLASLAMDKSTAVAKAAAKVRDLFAWPEKPGMRVSRAEPLTNAQQASFDSGKQTFAGLCAACHQVTGQGLDGLAPPLVDSEWVKGSEERLIRIVLHGVRGPLHVKGTLVTLDMPAAGFLTDDQIAGVLTYLRREWGHEEPPVSSETVSSVRKFNATRQDAWTEAELLGLK